MTLPPAVCVVRHNGCPHPRDATALSKTVLCRPRRAREDSNPRLNGPQLRLYKLDHVLPSLKIVSA
jgi:hypothetical protein